MTGKTLVRSLGSYTLETIVNNDKMYRYLNYSLYAMYTTCCNGKVHLPTSVRTLYIHCFLQALSASRAGKIMLAPPTSYTLYELARCGNISRVFDHLDVRHFDPIHPKRGETEVPFSLLNFRVPIILYALARVYGRVVTDR